MSDLKLDTDFLQRLGTDLRNVATEFEHANARSDDAARSVGHDGLAGKIEDFAHGWDDRRAKMLGSISTLGASAQAIGDAFEQVEDALVAALVGEA